MFDSLVSVWSLIDFAFPNTVLQEFHNNWILIGLLHRPENFPLVITVDQLQKGPHCRMKLGTVHLEIDKTTRLGFLT